MINDKLSSYLPRTTMDELSPPKEDILSITGLVRNNGIICGYRLSNNRFISQEEGVSMVKSGLLKDVGIVHSRNSE